MPPGAASGQHEHDRAEDRPVLDPGDPAALGTLGMRLDQRRSDLPEPVGHKTFSELVHA